MDRSERDLPDGDLASLATLVAAHAAIWLVRLPAVTDDCPSPTDPAWLAELRARLHAYAERQRTIVLEET